MRPGGRKREEKELEGHRAVIRGEEGEGQRPNHSNPPSNMFPLQDGHCRSSASLLGKENTRKLTEGLFPGEEGHGMALPPLPASQFLQPLGNQAGLCLVPIARSLGGVLALHRGSRGDPGRGARLPHQLSFPPQPAPQPPATASPAFPCGLLPRKEHRLSSGHPDVRREAEREDSREGEGVGGAVVAAARAGLNEPSHSLATLTVGQGRRCGELGCWSLQSCLSLSPAGRCCVH